MSDGSCRLHSEHGFAWGRGCTACTAAESAERSRALVRELRMIELDRASAAVSRRNWEVVESHSCTLREVQDAVDWCAHRRRCAHEAHESARLWPASGD